mgnify:CR=1 FL=1
METLLDLLDDSARRYGARNALGLRRDDGTTYHWSYAELRRRSRLAAWRLRALGLQPGDRLQAVKDRWWSESFLNKGPTTRASPRPAQMASPLSRKTLGFLRRQGRWVRRRGCLASTTRFEVRSRP